MTMIRYENPLVFGAGAANFDINCIIKEPPLVMKDSNLVSMVASSGGVTRNILENLARLGVQSAMLSAYGDDAYGDRLRKDAENAGIDMSRVRLCQGVSSSSYVSVQDADGDMAVAFCDTSVLGNIDPAYFDSYKADVCKAKVAVCDPSMPIDLLEYFIFNTAEDVPVFLDPVSTNFARQCIPLVKGVDTIKPNRMELEAMTGHSTATEADLRIACEKMLELGARRVVVSMGRNGCYLMDRDGLEIRRQFKPIENMANATGAGDSFMAGLIYGFVNGLSDTEALDCALATGTIAVLSEHTIEPNLSVEMMRNTIAKYRM